MPISSTQPCEPPFCNTWIWTFKIAIFITNLYKLILCCPPSEISNFRHPRLTNISLSILVSELRLLGSTHDSGLKHRRNRNVYISIPNIAITKYINILFKIKEVKIGRTCVKPHIEVSHGESRDAFFTRQATSNGTEKKTQKARNLILLYVFSACRLYIIHASYYLF